MSKMKELQASINEYYQLKANLVEKLKNDIQPITVEFFNTIPEIVAVTWVQYIPGFNDGDACEFTKSEMEFVIKSNVIDNEDYIDEIETYTTDFYQLKKQSWFETYETEIRNFMSLFGDETIMEEIFGVDTRIIITSDGITTIDYDCGY